jgi:hypothetical protein
VRILLLSVSLLSLLAACTSQLPLAYAPSSEMSLRGPATVATVSAVDQRGETASDANWFGAIRGGFGNPLKRLETDRPLTDVVASAVRDALRARGLLGDPGAGYDVQIAIQQFEADQVVRREAKVQLRLTWIRRSNGQPAFVNQGQADIVNGSIINMESGVFGSIEELQKLTAQAMSQAIDQALNDPKLQIFTSATAAN